MNTPFLFNKEKDGQEPVKTLQLWRCKEEKAS